MYVKWRAPAQSVRDSKATNCKNVNTFLLESSIYRQKVGALVVSHRETLISQFLVVRQYKFMKFYVNLC